MAKVMRGLARAADCYESRNPRIDPETIREKAKVGYVKLYPSGTKWAAISHSNEEKQKKKIWAIYLSPCRYNKDI